MTRATGRGRVGALVRAVRAAGVAAEVQLPSGEVVAVGPAPPAVRLVLRTDRLLRAPIHELALGRAYVEGDLDVEGDPVELLRLRDGLRDRTPLRQALSVAGQLALAAPTWVNSRAIRHHYGIGDDLFLTFLDRRYRFYSQCLFASDDETLERAAERKLETMWAALGLEPGMRLLDIGGGWGGVVEFCAARGVHVTTLTLTEASATYIRGLARRLDLEADVRVEDLLRHRPERPYDHAVIFGVIEHIPTYRRFSRTVWDALVPGGRLYLDGSATTEKYSASAFTRHYTWRGPHSCLALQDLLEELVFHGLDVVEVRRETRDYELTMRHWAERLDAVRAAVVARWGEEVYRAFRVFLWGGSHAFATNRLQAYHVVAERTGTPGPRPGVLRRAGHFVASLR